MTEMQESRTEDQQWNNKRCKDKPTVTQIITRNRSTNRELLNKEKNDCRTTAATAIVF